MSLKEAEEEKTDSEGSPEPRGSPQSVKTEAEAAVMQPQLQELGETGGILPQSAAHTLNSDLRPPEE